MRYFVTGGTGYLGNHVVHQLVDAGHDVVALVRSESKARWLPSGVEIATGDITEKESMREAMTGVDGVFHLAGWYQIGTGNPEIAVQVNVEGTRNVLELMAELGVSKGVYTSSVAVFSDTGGTYVDESYRYEGPHLSVYDQTKWQAHYEVAMPLIEDGLPLVIVMPGAVYGPPASGEMSDLRTMWQRYLCEELPFVTREGAACWDYVADSARAHLLAMEHGEPGETYVISGECRTFVDALSLAEELTGIPAPRSISPRWFRMLAPIASRIERFVTLPKPIHPELLYWMAGTTWLADNSKATRELGLTHRSLEDGLGEYLEWEQTQLS